MGKISQNAKTLMALSSINNLLTAIWEVIRDRIPVLSNGKIPVDVASLNVTVSNASLEIANDVGNPVPVSAASLPLPTLAGYGIVLVNEVEELM